MDPTVDIFVPFWGDPKLLRATVESVRAQDDARWHLTVVDDAYDDASVAAYFAQLDDPRVTYLRNERNLGIIENFRRCKELATRNLVVFVGCDDLLHPGYVGVVLAAHAEFPRAAVIQPGVRVIDETGADASGMADRVKRWITPRGVGRVLLEGEALAASLLRGNWLYWPSLAFRREPLEAVDFLEQFTIVLDLGLILDIVYDGGSLVLDRTECFSYRRHKASLSSTALRDGPRLPDERAFFAMAARRTRALGWGRATRAARLHLTSRLHALTLLPAALRARRGGAARSLLRHVFGR